MEVLLVPFYGFTLHYCATIYSVVIIELRIDATD